MVTSVGMPPGWEPVGRDKKGWVYRWCKGSNDRVRYNIRPWKKADGTFVWRCHPPAFKGRDTFVEFLDPVSCAVAQEVQGG